MNEEKSHRHQMPGQGMYQMPMPAYPMMPMQSFPPPVPANSFQPSLAPYPSQSAEPVPNDNMLPLEQSYVENILRLNRGKVATIYMTFENNERWNAKIFKGIIEAAGRDHIIISDPETEKRYLLLTIYLDYITFDERINYDYPTA
ncbi:spore coat protein GerQ [Amphibacillus sp. MSJ-3]|uniref:spore coat protein GerQ n=1 Tax=Amphibacillus sp. MSJ-3 TaxID=2841505 RepID=UPI001C0F22BF|nr:spore coat protein GerQ [Amphibacillus sp. MSJ-3]MBU5594829.1 spore coat protein GerQ [Amphibacillus sp. MSJ-3]